MTEAVPAKTEDQHLCGRRSEVPFVPEYIPKFDTWQTLPNGDRVCSFCGSLHHDDFMRLVKEAADPNKYTYIEKATGKNYKYYVHRKDVANAAEGGIKFYTQHTPSQEWVDEINTIFKEAIVVSGQKFNSIYR